jgi:hypothetical protein
MADATIVINQIITSLDGLAGEPLRLISDDRPFNQIWGWNMPAMNRHEFADFIRSPIKPLRDITAMDIDPADVSHLERIPSEVAVIQSGSIPNLPSGNAFHVYLTVDSLVRKIFGIIDKYRKQEPDWEEIEANKLAPASLVRQLRQLQTEISTLKAKKKDLEASTNRIVEAAAASRSLKVDIEGLRIARDAFTSSQQTISEHQTYIEGARRSADNVLGEVRGLKAEAEKLVQDTQGAFAAATTICLGREFDTKAKNLATEVFVLSLGLIIVITIGGFITYYRVNFIHELMSRPAVNMDLIWANIVTMFASLAGPVWLAWLMTKQIGQRFRLSEDYAFKASVAKAYAGYRLEAGKLGDPEFEKRLFSTALNRIDEEPLRYVEHESDGSPWHSLLRRRRWRVGPVETSDIPEAQRTT